MWEIIIKTIYFKMSEIDHEKTNIPIYYNNSCKFYKLVNISKYIFLRQKN